MILAKELDDGRVALSFPYDKSIINIIKNLNYRKWNPERKEWVVTKDGVKQLQNQYPELFPKNFKASNLGGIKIKVRGNEIDNRNLPFLHDKGYQRLVYTKNPSGVYKIAEILERNGYDVAPLEFGREKTVELKPQNFNLYPYQEDCVEFFREHNYSGINALSMGLGKLIEHSVPVLTTKGWKTHGELEVGDHVFGLDGKPKIIQGTSSETNCNMKITFKNGKAKNTFISFETHENHIWLLEKATKDIGLFEEYSTKELIGNERFKNGKTKFFLPRIKPLEFEEQNLPINPYWFGLWLGDGNKDLPRITQTPDDVKEWIDTIPYNITKEYKNGNGSANQFDFTKQGIKEELRNLNVFNNKHIPDIYKYSSKEQRLELIGGLIDSDGRIKSDRDIYVFDNGNLDIIKALKEIILSLGFSCSKIIKRKNKKTIINNREISWKDTYSISFVPSIKIPCRLERHKINNIRERKRLSLYSVEYINSNKKGKCIQVEDGNYLIGKDLIPTHNSLTSLMSFHESDAKNLLIIAPSGLLQQWSDVLLEFFDTESVIVSSKTPPEDRKKLLEEEPLVITSFDIMWRTIGLNIEVDMLIIDEASKIKNWKTNRAQALHSIIAKYRQGLTGTPIENRLEELFNISDNVVPGFYGSAKSFFSYYAKPKRRCRSDENPLELLYEKNKELVFRKTKEDVQNQLPQKTIMARSTDLTVPELRLMARIDDKDEEPIGVFSRLKVHASNPALYMDMEKSSKEKLLEELLVDDLEGRKIVVFSQYAKNIPRFKKIAEENNIKALYLSGKNSKDLNSIRDKFVDEDYQILFMTQVGEYGLDKLQVADVLINFDLPYNPAQIEQRIGRVHRLGSEHDNVLIINLISNGTLDEYLIRILTDKVKLRELALKGGIKKELMRELGLLRDKKKPKGIE